MTTTTNRKGETAMTTDNTTPTWDGKTIEKGCRLADAEPGDLVIVGSGSSRTAFRRVVKVTKTQIVTADQQRFRKNGLAVGGSGYSRLSIRFPKDAGEISELRQAAEERAEKRREEKLAAREAAKGRCTGFLMAAEDALKASQSEFPNEFTEHLLQRLWMAQSDLRSAEKNVLASAKQLREQAEEMERGLERDAEYACPLWSGIHEAQTVEETRVRCRKAAMELTYLIAKYLDKDAKEMVAPMAKVADPS